MELPDIDNPPIRNLKLSRFDSAELVAGFKNQAMQISGYQGIEVRDQDRETRGLKPCLSPLSLCYLPESQLPDAI